jgi:hypothetical protein
MRINYYAFMVNISCVITLNIKRDRNFRIYLFILNLFSLTKIGQLNGVNSYNKERHVKATTATSKVPIKMQNIFIYSFRCGVT